jgi:hypothetical protein
MATLIPSIGTCAGRMNRGERRLAERLEQKLDDDYLVPDRKLSVFDDADSGCSAQFGECSRMFQDCIAQMRPTADFVWFRRISGGLILATGRGRRSRGWTGNAGHAAFL